MSEIILSAIDFSVKGKVETDSVVNGSASNYSWIRDEHEGLNCEGRVFSSVGCYFVICSVEGGIILCDPAGPVAFDETLAPLSGVLVHTDVSSLHVLVEGKFTPIID